MHHRKPRKRFVQLGGIAVSVVKGDITQQTTDVIVNSATSDLILSKGTASKALLEAAGDTIQTECRQKYPFGITSSDVAITGAGNLNCKAIYHVTLPTWTKPGDEKIIETVVQKCLQEAHRQNFQSLSFPALGTGYLKYPNTVVVTSMFKAVDDFSQNNPRSSIKVLNCVVFKKETFTDFLNEARKRASKGTEELELKTKTSLKETIGNIQVTVSVGSIVTEKADVIVNTCATDMKLESRPGLSKALSEAAGSKLQEEINRRYPNGIQTGELAVTGGYSAHCSKIFHGHLTSFFAKKHNGLLPEQVLYNFVHKCLEEANKHSVTSIAFPALGTGYIKFPAKTAALKVIQAIKDFQQTTPGTSIQNIKIVIFGGTPDWTSVEQAYLSQFTSPSQKGTLGSQAEHIVPKRGTRDFLKYKYTEDERTPPYWTHFKSSKTIKEWNISHKGDPYKVTSVDKHTYQSISNAFINTNSGATIVSIERIENILLYEQYIQECQRTFRKAFVTHIFNPLKNVNQSTGTACTMQHLDDAMTKHLHDEINEFYLFHGTKYGYVDVIIQQGLDDRLASSGLLGTGVYTAELADKSACYTDQNQKGERKMFLMRVCLGDIFITKQSSKYRRPPCKECYTETCTNHTELFDSVVAEFNKREFVVYDRAKCYPEYLITYK